jgi:hypothetical protein
VTNHTAASGLRLYDDAIAQPSQVFNQAGPAYLSTSTLYLHSRGGTNFLDTNAPKGKTPALQDSAAVSFSQSCASDGASGLCPAGHNQWHQIGTGWSE